jgi:hypothetical protein
MMKRLLIVSAIFLFTGIAFGQMLQKEAVLAIRTTKNLVLKPEVSMNQYLDVLMTKWAPEFEKIFPDTKVIFMKGDRGEMANGYAWIWYFPNKSVRDKYFTPEGEMKDAALGERMQKVGGIMNDYVIDSGMAEYTDWIVL